MIKANELRIGNLVQRLDGSVRKVDWADLRDLPKPHTLKPEPICLTEEWLIKFGFIQRRNSEWYELTYSERGNYLLYGLGNGYTEACLTQSTTAQGPTKYVHQLQNLYFALTGQELEVKN